MVGPLEPGDGGVDHSGRVVIVSLLQRLERHVGRRMLAGFIVLVPLAVTYVILRLVFINLDDLFRPWVKDRLPIFDFPGVGLVFVVVVLYVVGGVVAVRLGRRAVTWQHAIFSRIPVVKSIYGVVSQVTEALSTPMEQHFSRVVFVEWPRPGFWALGFVTGRFRSPDGKGPDKVVVYVPTVPNPTSGNLAFVEVEDIVESDMSVEDAMKLVFSGGIILPGARRLAEPQKPA